MKTAAYIGWLGHNNIGDEACYQVICDLVKDHYKLIPWDSGSWKYKKLPNLCIVGGGTILDIKFGRRERDLLLPMFEKNIPIIIWGSGIVDPPKNLDSRVLNILNNAKFVGVRGPISKSILDSKGFLSSEIIGDPALLLSTSKKNSTLSNKVSINIGYTRNNLYGTEKHVIKQTKKLIELLEAKNFEIELFSMWPKDEEILKQLGKNRIRPWDPSIPNLMNFMKDCYCVVGMKLHSCVLSAAANVPFISLGYRNKCFDFAQSINLEKWVFRTDAVWAKAVFNKLLTVEKYKHIIVKRIKKYKEHYIIKHKKLLDLI